MPNKEDVLRDETFKDQTDTTSQRVFCTLRKSKGNEQHRTMLLLSLLIERLEAKEIIDEEDLDAMLIELHG